MAIQDDIQDICGACRAEVSIRQLADESGVSENTIRHWQRARAAGRTPNAGLLNVGAVKAALERIRFARQATAGKDGGK